MAGNNEYKTSLVISAETKGFDKALRQALGLSEKSLDSMKKQAEAHKKNDEYVKSLEKGLGTLLKRQADLHQQMMKVGDTGSKSYQKMEDRMQSLREATKNVSESIRLQERAYAGEAKAARTLEKAIQGITREQERKAQQERKAFEQQQAQDRQVEAMAEKQRKGAFAQGFMQAAAPGMAPLFLQRGPGMWRQTAGMLAGGALRRGAAGAWGMTGGAAFQGIQGMQQGLGAIPGIGGLLAGQLGSAAGYSQMSLQHQRQLVGLAPYVAPDARMMAQASQAEARAAQAMAGARAIPKTARTSAYMQGGYRQLLQEAMVKMQGTELGEGVNLANMPKITPTSNEFGTGFTIENSLAQTLSGKQMDFLSNEVEKLGLEVYDRATSGKGPGGWSDIYKRFDVAGTQSMHGAQDVLTAAKGTAGFEASEARRAARRARARAFGSPVSAGRRLMGQGRTESLEFMGQLMQTGGGRFEAGAPGMQPFMEAAMGAQTLYGVGAETSGAFLQASRRGGLVGGRGRAGEELREALQDAVELGLNGAEINQYMQSVAQGIQQFQQTGIPMAKDSLKDMGLELSKGGLAPTRAQAVAQGFQRMVQNVGARGPTGGLDLMLMQQFGGYQGGGGPEALEQAFIQMEEMGERIKGGGLGALASDQAMSGTMRRIMEMGGGGAGGRLFLRRQLAARGINVGAREMSILGKSLEGKELTDEEQAIIARPQEAPAKGPGRTIEEMSRRAAQVVSNMGPNLRQQAALMDKQLAVGNKLATAVMNMEQSAANTTSAFTNLAGKPITNLSKSLEKFTAKLDKITEEDGVLDRLRIMMGIG